MKKSIFRSTAAATIAVAGLAMCYYAHASKFTVTSSSSGSGTRFIVTRDDTTAAETVHYRTVSLSAYAGQHYTAKSGTLTFPAGQSAVTNTVTETTPSSDAYKFQTGTSRYYRFELTDAGGFLVTNATRSLTTGTRVTASSAFGAKDLPINAGTITVTDGGYDQAYHSVTVNNYFTAAAPKDYLVAAGAQLRATVTFHAREKDDGYQYVAIYANTSTSNIDTGAKDGDPGTVSYSRYMSGFTIDGNVSSTWYPYTFPLTSKGHACGEQTHPWSGNSNGNLKQQYFKSNCRAADGRLIIPTDLSSLYVRLNASGNLNDTWYASNVVAHVQAVDTAAPARLATAVAPGIRARGNEFYVSVAFSEPVTCSSATLTNSWGTLNYTSGSGSNVLTFKGTIPAAATGALNITGWSGNIKDLAGNPLDATALTQKNLATLDTSHAYAIAYDLAGGALPEGASNPATYTYETPSFTLATPTRPGYTFAGWTGSNGTIPQTSVTVASQSHGDLAYTANWKLPYIDADGTERICADYTVLTNATGNVTYGANGTEVWYVVTTNVNISGQLLFNGTAHLILCDGATLAVTNENGYAISSYSFAIYGQTNGTGTVTATGGDSGIYAQYGAVTINGGTITATGNYGIYAYGGYVTINGGTITAAGASKGIYAYNRSVTINGGTVTATGNHGISGDSVTINGGTVTANATATSGTGIYAFYDVTINGGTVTANGSSSYGIDAKGDIILGWTNPTDSITASKYYALYGNVSVKDGQRLTDCSNIYESGNALSPSDLAGKTLQPVYSITLPEGVIASGVVTQIVNTAYALPDTAVTLSPAPGYAIGDITVNGVPLAGGTCSFAASDAAVTIAATMTPITYAVRFDSGADGVIGSMPDQSFTYDEPQALSSNAFTRANHAFVGWRGADGTIYPDRVTVLNLTNAQDAVVSLVAQWGIPYIDEDGTEQICTDYTVITNAAGDVEYGANGEESWYVVTNAVTISGQLRFTGSNTHLILCDGATLTITNENGIAINANDLTIYGQTNGTGAIDAYGDCGILGRGNLTINSGSVTAAGKNGGGISASSVTINGGTVTANGKSSICIYANNDITINGGTVTANGTNGNGIRAQNGSVTLGWTKPTDSITASSYYANNGNVSVKSDQTLTDGNAIYESGNGLNPSDLRGVTLRPAYRITLPAGVVASGVILQNDTTAYALPGTNVTLSAAAPGYAIGNVIVNGNALTSVDGVYTFTASAASITVTAAVCIPVPYIDADGVEPICADYTVITNATGDVRYGEWGAESWYVVTNNVTISGQLYFYDFTAHLILCDGATLAVTNANGNAIDACDLTIYGQTNGTGTVNASGGDSGIYADNGAVTINGGTVTANGGDSGIYAAYHGSVTINGGTVTANGGNYGIVAANSIYDDTPQGTIILGWTNPTDSITASSYGGFIYAKDDQRLTDGSAIYESSLGESPSALRGVTLRPAYSITLPEGVVASGVVTQDGNTAYALPDATVTLSPAPGYAIGNVIVNGNALTSVDGVYTFTASAASITVTATVGIPVPYIDEDGVERQCFSYTVLTNATGDVEYGEWGAESWYVVTNNVTISGQLYFDGTAHLIICDDATLAVTNENVSAISAYCLTIYGQANGTGTVTAEVTNGDGISTGTVTINGGTVTANGDLIGISAGNSVTINGGTVTANATTNGGTGIYADGSVTINGGTVTANGEGYGDGIYAKTGITLGWRSPTDSITASSYNSIVFVKSDQRLTDGSKIYESGFGYPPFGLAGKTLRPAYSITLPEGVVASGVVTQDGTTAYALPGDTVTLSPAPGYAICNVTVNDNAIDPVDGVYTFTASAASITVTATVFVVSSVIEIGTGAEFAEYMASRLVSYSDITFAFTNDIDMSGVTYTRPSGDFNATLDGRGHTLTSLSLKKDMPNLIGTLKGTVRDLTIAGYSSPGNVGGTSLIAYSSSGGTLSGVVLTNCTWNLPNVTSGTAGFIYETQDNMTTITNCWLVDCRVIGYNATRGDQVIGGFVAKASQLKMVDCHVVFSNTNIISIGNGIPAAGAFIGQTAAGVTIERCTSNARVKTASNVATQVGGAGGFVGVATMSGSPVIRDCANFGIVESTVPAYPAGGFIGEVGSESGDFSLTVQSCFNYGDVASPVAAGGLIGRYRGASSTLSNNGNSGAISSEAGFAGGLVGLVCYNVANRTWRILNAMQAGAVSTMSGCAGLLVGGVEESDLGGLTMSVSNAWIAGSATYSDGGQAGILFGGRDITAENELTIELHGSKVLESNGTLALYYDKGNAAVAWDSPVTFGAGALSGSAVRNALNLYAREQKYTTWVRGRCFPELMTFGVECFSGFFIKFR